MPFRQEILDIVLSELAKSSTNAVGTDRNKEVGKLWTTYSKTDIEDTLATLDKKQYEVRYYRSFEMDTKYGFGVRYR